MSNFGQEDKEFAYPEAVIPEAYLDDISGKNIIARLKITKEYIVLVAPDYTILESIGGIWVKDSAITKHGFIEFMEPQTEKKSAQEMRTAYGNS